MLIPVLHLKEDITLRYSNNFISGKLASFSAGILTYEILNACTCTNNSRDELLQFLWKFMMNIDIAFVLDMNVVLAEWKQCNVDNFI